MLVVHRRRVMSSEVRTTLILCSIAMSGCQASGAVLNPRYAPRVSAASSVVARPFSEVAEARGMPSLSSVVLPDGSREIRLTDSYGMAAGRKIPMLRVVETPEGVTGEVILFWATADAPLAPSTPGCVRWREAMSTCVSVATSDVDWPAVAAEIDRLGGWTLTESCRARSDLISATDAGDLLIQRLDGDRFETYRCNAPRRRSDTDADSRSLALWNYVLSWGRR